MCIRYRIECEHAFNVHCCVECACAHTHTHYRRLVALLLCKVITEAALTGLAYPLQTAGGYIHLFLLCTPPHMHTPVLGVTPPRCVGPETPPVVSRSTPGPREKRTRPACSLEEGGRTPCGAWQGMHLGWKRLACERNHSQIGAHLKCLRACVRVYDTHRSALPVCDIPSPSLATPK